MIGGLSMTELVIILGLALLLLGPDQLPTLAKTLGKGLRELRKATDDIKGQFEQEIASVDLNEDKSRRMIAPLQTTTPAGPAAGPIADPAADPAAARANARAAASTGPDDPAAARAAARRASVAPIAELPGHGEAISFPRVPEGTVPARDPKA